jgi:hypothetical protein
LKHAHYAAALATLAASAPALAAEVLLERLNPSLYKAEQDANEQCRGGALNDPATVKACQEREVLDAEIRKLGCHLTSVGYVCHLRVR